MTRRFKSQKLWSLTTVIALSIAIRVVLILYSDWHDARSVVKYTDIDYRVFSDAASYLLHPGPGDINHARGPFGKWSGMEIPFGDPYTRETYRYTPLLALILAPNEWLHPSFGKYLFAACDIVNGILIYHLLVAVILPRASLRSQFKDKSETPLSSTKELATKYAAIHLLNPMVFSISTRGSSESVLSLFVLLTLHAALLENWTMAAVLLGASTHWKIYPGVYGIACLGAVTGMNGLDLRKLVHRGTIAFGLVSVSTFVLLGLGCYLVWGYPFLHESYLYHLHRKDHRHNFSPYFYMTYLTYGENSSSMLQSPLVSFVPQMVLTLGSGLLFGRKQDLPFAWFMQTCFFVVFNKVCTSQYFLWYLLLLPLIIPSLSMTLRRAVACLAVWAGVQGLWLSEAYQLEFLGRNVFFGLWVRGLVYFVGNCWVIANIMESYKGSA